MTGQTTEIGTAAPLGGLAPRGMLWVSWRQRRSLIFITLALYATATVALVVARMIRAHQLAATGVTDLAACTDIGMTSAVVGACERWLVVHSSWSGTIGQLNNASYAICVLFGLGLGAAVVGHELEKGLGSYSFTQSISPTRWAATQLGVVMVSGALAVVIFDVFGRIWTSGRAVIGDDPRGVFGNGLWSQAVMLLVMVCLGFGMSVLSGSSSGGFWGGLGTLVVGGLLAGLLARPPASAVFVTGIGVPCTGPEDGLCDRVSSAVSQFQALAHYPVSDLSAATTIALPIVGLVGLVGGFVTLRRRFR